MATLTISSAASAISPPKPTISSSVSAATGCHEVLHVPAIKSSSFSAILYARRRGRMIHCEVALRPDSGTSVSEASSSASISEDDEELSRAAAAADRIGARVRVKVGLKVFHVPKVAEVDLTGMEGQIKQYVGLWKGKRISANLPFKVEFVTNVEGRGPVKFFAHLKEDEFEYVDAT